MIIITHPDGVIMPKNQHIGEMILLSSSDASWHPPSVNEVIHDISSDHIDIQYSKTTLFKIHSNSQPILETSVLMPNNLQIHRQVPLCNAKISSETKIHSIKCYRNMII